MFKTNNKLFFILESLRNHTFVLQEEICNLGVRSTSAEDPHFDHVTHRRVHGLVTYSAGTHGHAVVVVTLAYDRVHRAQVVLARRGIRTLRHPVAEVN